MPILCLTDKTVKTIPLPDKGQQIYFDTILTGFALRVSQGGAKTFLCVYGENRRKVTIGRYGIITLQQARERARYILAQSVLNPSKQGTLFRFVIRLMLSIPEANIHTLLEIMDGKHKEHIRSLSATAQLFFNTQFEERDYKATRQQVIRRIWTVIENPLLERMFSAPQTRFNIKDEIDTGKIVLINTAKDLSKQTGTEIMGRYFIASLAMTVQGRTGYRHPTPQRRRCTR